MRRRLDLAMALIHEPEVLFLDEPTTGLDPVSRLTLWDEVRRLKDEGTTVSRLLATFPLALVQTTFFIVIGLIFGARVQGGVPGFLLVLAIGGIAGTGFGGIGVVLALRARNASLVQGVFPLAFVILFLSSAFFPRRLLTAPADWLAAYNPTSYIADGMRNPIIASIDAGTVLEGLAAATALTVAMAALSVLSLRGRLREP